MNVGELKKAIADTPDDWEMVISRDPEGNGFRLGDVDVANNNYTGEGECVEIGLATLNDELKRQGYTEEDINNGKPCIVFW